MMIKPTAISIAAASACLALAPTAAQTGAVSQPTGAARPSGIASPSGATIQNGTATFQGAVGGGVVVTGSGPIFFSVPSHHIHGFNALHLGFGRRGSLGFGYPGPYRRNHLYPNILNPNPSPPIQFMHVGGPANTGADLDDPGEADLLTKAGLRLGMGRGDRAAELCVEAINNGAGPEASRMLALALAVDGQYAEAAAVARSALSAPARARAAPPEACTTDIGQARRVSAGAHRHARMTDSASAWLLAIDVARATGSNHDAARWIEAAEQAGLASDIAGALRQASGP